MKILMLGWEFPPKISGGLGIASQGIAEGLSKAGNQITFLLPKQFKEQKSKILKLLDASAMSVDPDFWEETSTELESMRDIQLGSQIVAYMPPAVIERLTGTKKVKKIRIKNLENKEVQLSGTYNDNLLNETGKYALLAVQLAKKQQFDLVYAHDWPTFKAGRLIKELIGTPLAVHVHSTEFDRNGVFAHPLIASEEGIGIKAAKYVFAVSQRTKNAIADQYQIKANKITVVPNAATPSTGKNATRKIKEKTIAFIGRFTDQKSPGTVIDIARELTSKGKNYRYLMIGDGYLKQGLMDKAEQLNLSERFRFTGFLSHEKVLKLLSEIDLLIAPSVSEPFGLIMLEAIYAGVPVISTPGSGLSEFIPDIVAIEKWNIHNYADVAEKIIEDADFRNDITEKCLNEAQQLSWDKTAHLINDQIV